MPIKRTFDYDRAAELYREGALVKDIASRLNTSETAVRRALRIVGVRIQPDQRRKANMRRRKLDDLDVTLIRLQRSQGMSWREIGRSLEVNHNVAYNALQRWIAENRQEDPDGEVSTPR